MCVVSMIMDHYGDKWRDRQQQWPYTTPYPYQPLQPKQESDEEYQKRLAEFFERAAQPKEPAITDAEIKEFRQLLERAREYDKRNNEPECELEEKKEAVRQVAKQLGVEINFL
jgi:hypothetical protein